MTHLPAPGADLGGGGRRSTGGGGTARPVSASVPTAADRDPVHRFEPDRRQPSRCGPAGRRFHIRVDERPDLAEAMWDETTWWPDGTPKPWFYQEDLRGSGARASVGRSTNATKTRCTVMPRPARYARSWELVTTLADMPMSVHPVMADRLCPVGVETISSGADLDGDRHATYRLRRTARPSGARGSGDAAGPHRDRTRDDDRGSDAATMPAGSWRGSRPLLEPIWLATKEKSTPSSQGVAADIQLRRSQKVVPSVMMGERGLGSGRG